MSDKSHGRMSGRSVMAVLVISCMLACAVSPVVTTWNNDASDVVAHNGDDGDFVYVSLGDSMVSGFGMIDYYEEGTGKNTFGFEKTNVADTYPNRLVSEYLDKVLDDNVDVIHHQLASSGFRSSELRYILDPNFEGDRYDVNNAYINNAIKVVGEKMGIDKPTINDLRDYFIECLAEADLVTYQYHWDVGYIIGQSLMSITGLEPPVDMRFDLYIDEEALEFIKSLKADILDYASEALSEQGIDVASYEPLIEMVENFANSVAYAILSYCCNFDANMELIFGLNPDVQVVVLDCYNNLNEMNLVFGDYSIPADSLLDVLYDVINLYTEYLSPYSFMTYHVDIDESVDVFSDEFLTAESGADLTDDTKMIVEGIFENLFEYDMIDSNNSALTKMLKYVFQTTELDLGWVLTNGIDIDGMMTKISLAIGAMTTGVADVISDGDGGCIITRNGEEAVNLDKYDLGMLWVYFTNNAMGGAIGHPNNNGHNTVFNNLVYTLESNRVLTSNPKCPIFGDSVASMPTESGAVGTLVSLTDTLGMLNTDASLVAESLGLELDYTMLPSGTRVSDIVYLLGGTDNIDAYGQDLLGNTSADLEISIEELRQIYQVAVANSSAVLVSAGGDSLIFAASEIMKIMNGEEATYKDFYQFESLDPGFVYALAKIKAGINGILVDMFGADSEIVSDFEVASEIVETVAYSVLGYTDYYTEMLDSIIALNPDAQIIVIGAYNLLDGFVYENAETGISIDVGAMSFAITKAYNMYTMSQIIECGNSNVSFIDMTDAHNNTETVNIADINLDNIMDYLQYFVLDEDAFNTQVEGIEWYISSVEYTLTLDIEGSIITENYYFGETILVDDPIKTGYTFVGWEGEIPETMPACDLYFYGEFEANEYTVTWYVDGEVWDEETYYYGDEIVAPATDVEGYTFVEWDAIVPETMPAEDLEFNAVLDINEYTVTWYVDGVEYDKDTYDYGADIVAPADPSKVGYEFGGWDAAVPETMPAEDLEFNAVFNILQYTITYYLNGAVYQTYTYDYGAAVEAANPSKPGYIFNGWDAAVPETMPAEDLSFYGTSTPITYTVVFDANGGEGTMAGMSFTYDVLQTLDANAFTKENFYFAGWNTAANGSGTSFDDEAVVSNLTAEDGATVTLYAQWNGVPGTVLDLETAKSVAAIIFVLAVISTIMWAVALRKH